MSFLNDNVFDNGLSWLDTNGTRIDICSQEPTTYTEATSTYSLGDAAINVPGPTNGATDGRRVVVPAVSGATVDSTGTASHWAITNGSDTLCAANSLASSQSVTAGNTFNLGSFSITLRDPS